MVIIENESICLFPLYYHSLLTTTDKRFSAMIVNGELMGEVVGEIRKRNSRSLFVIDMQFMQFVSDSKDKSLERLLVLSGINIMLINIQKDPDTISLVENQMKSTNTVFYDIHTCKLLGEDERKLKRSCAALSIPSWCEYDTGEIANVLHSANNLYKAQVMQKIIDECIDKGVQYLPSSDVYSNMYINVKELFKDHGILSLCIYLLCKLIRDNFSNTRIDCIVSMSNTGAILANLVGITLDKEVLYCSNVGPQFALDIDALKDRVVRGGNYLYIFDFMCLGTEIKIVKSILSCYAANVVGGVGIASYIDLESLRRKEPSEQESRSSLKHAYSIVNLREAAIDYRIAVDSLMLEG